MAPKEKLEPTKQPLTAVLLADSFTQVTAQCRRPWGRALLACVHAFSKINQTDVS